MGVRAPLAARHVARCRRRQHPPSNNTSNGIWGRHGEQGPAAIALLPLSMLGQAALVAAGRLQVGCRSAVRRYGGGSSQAACGAAAPSASFRHAPLPRRVASDSCNYHSERATGTCATGGLLHTFRAWNSPTEFDGRRDPRARQQSSSISLRTPVARCVWPQLCVRRAASAGRQPWDLTYDETFLS